MQPFSLKDKDLDQLWTDLAGEDAVKAHQAIWALVAGANEAIPDLQKRLRPIPLDPKKVEQLITELDAEKFPDREKAREALEELAELAEPLLKKALAAKPALEVRNRLERLLEKVEKERFSLNPHRLRVLRTIEALEQIGSPEARKLLG